MPPFPLWFLEELNKIKHASKNMSRAIKIGKNHQEIVLGFKGP
jgi:hypothetical protein